MENKNPNTEIRAAHENHKLLSNTEEILILLIGHYSDLKDKKQQHPLFNIRKVILVSQRYQYKSQSPKASRSTFITCNLNKSMSLLAVVI